MEDKRINPDTHFYLYAKHQYLQTDLIKDLRKLVAEKCLISYFNVKEVDVVNELLSITLDQIILQSKDLREIKRRITEFIEMLQPQNRRYLRGTSDESLNLGILRKCLSALRHTELKYIPNLGEVEPHLLPLSLKGDINSVADTKGMSSGL